MPTPDLAHSPLSDAALLDEATRLAAEGRRATSELVAVLVALDARRLYLAEGYQSLFDFCQRRLRLSESEAYHRIEAARTARLFPSIVERLREGTLTLTNVALLRSHLTEANHAALLAWAEGRSKREVEMFVRTLDPRPDVPASIRRLPQPRRSAKCLLVAETRCADAAEMIRTGASQTRGEDAACATSAALQGLAAARQADGTHPPGLGWDRTVEGEPSAAPPRVAVAALCAPRPARPAEIRPLAPARYSLHVTISDETRAKLRRAQALLWHAEPNVDEAIVLDRALTLLVETLERRKFAALKPRPGHEKSRANSRSARRKQANRPPRRKPQGRAGDACGRRRDVGDVADAQPSRGDAQFRHREVAGPGTDPPAAAMNAGEAGEAAVAPEESAATPPPATPKMPTRTRLARPRHSRAIPAAVRREVWFRDGGACAYVGPAGRCGRTAGLEFHHRIPVADGGASSTANVSLRCRSHHAVESERWFGEDEARPAKISRGAAPDALEGARAPAPCPQRTSSLQLPPEGVGHK